MSFVIIVTSPLFLPIALAVPYSHNSFAGSTYLSAPQQVVTLNVHTARAMEGSGESDIFCRKYFNASKPDSEGRSLSLANYGPTTNWWTINYLGRGPCRDRPISPYRDLLININISSYTPVVEQLYPGTTGTD